MTIQMLKSLNIRSLYNKTTRTYYYSANDLCAVLVNGTYGQGKNRWKYLKRVDKAFDLSAGYVNTQLALPCANGKYHLSDVVSRKQLLYIIKISKSDIARKLQELISTSMNNLIHFRDVILCIGQKKRDEITINILQSGKLITLTRSYVSKVFRLNTPSSLSKVC